MASVAAPLTPFQLGPNWHENMWHALPTSSKADWLPSAWAAGHFPGLSSRIFCASVVHHGIPGMYQQITEVVCLFVCLYFLLLQTLMTFSLLGLSDFPWVPKHINPPSNTICPEPRQCIKLWLWELQLLHQPFPVSPGSEDSSERGICSAGVTVKTEMYFTWSGVLDSYWRKFQEWKWKGLCHIDSGIPLYIYPGCSDALRSHRRFQTSK